MMMWNWAKGSNIHEKWTLGVYMTITYRRKMTFSSIDQFGIHANPQTYIFAQHNAKPSDTYKRIDSTWCFTTYIVYCM